MSELAVSFDQIPGDDWLIPGHYVEFSTERALEGLSPMPHKSVLFGQVDPAVSTIAEGEVVQVLNHEHALDLFGYGMLADMVAAYRKNDKTGRLYCVPLHDDVAGVKAAGSVTFTALPTEAGTFTLYIGYDLENGRVRIKASPTQTLADLAVALAAAINDDPTMPVTAAQDGTDTAKVNLTARHAGECGNDIDLRFAYFGERMPRGLAVTLAPMTGGSGNPDISLALDAIEDKWTNTMGCPYSDGFNLQLLKDDLDERFHPLKQIGGHVYLSPSGTFSELSTFGQGHNSEHVSALGFTRCPTPGWKRAAALAGLVSYHARIDPARPFQTLALKGVAMPDKADQLSDEARNFLLLDGVATWEQEDGADELTIEYLVTTYKRNALGFVDPSYRDLNTKLTLQYLRYTWRAWLAQRYPRHKLRDDNGRAVEPGQAVVTPDVIFGEACAWFMELQKLELVEDYEQFKSELLTGITQNIPVSVSVFMVPNIINGFRQSRTKIAFIR